MDDQSYAVLSRKDLPSIRPIALGLLEAGDRALREVKANRSVTEYYFTCTPLLLMHILDTHSEVDQITYLDADLFFFGNPAALFAELDNGSIAVIEHRFPPRLKDLERHGLFNVGWLTFRRTDAARACLQWWRERCLEWCYDRVEGDRYADQKYLDQWPQLFPGVVVLRHKGANLAPWNLENYDLRWRDGRVWVDDDPLLFFHFHLLRRIGDSFCDLGLWRYGVRATRVVRRRIYEPYLGALRAQSHDLERTGDVLSPLGSARSLPPSPQESGQGLDPHGARNWIRSKQDLLRGLIWGDYVWWR